MTSFEQRQIEMLKKPGPGTPGSVVAATFSKDRSMAKLITDYPEIHDLMNEDRLSIHGYDLWCFPEDVELVLAIVELI